MPHVSLTVLRRATGTFSVTRDCNLVPQLNIRGDPRPTTSLNTAAPIIARNGPDYTPSAVDEELYPSARAQGAYCHRERYIWFVEYKKDGGDVLDTYP